MTTRSDPGILLARLDGDRLVLIDVPDAMPWPAWLAASVEHTLDELIGPRREHASADADTGQEAGT